MDKETKQMFELMLNKLNDIDERLDGVDKRFDGVDKRFEGINKRFDIMEKRQDEIYSVVMSIEHSNNMHKAEIDNLNYKVAHVEGIINKIGDVIVESRKVK